MADCWLHTQASFLAVLWQPYKILEIGSATYKVYNLNFVSVTVLCGFDHCSCRMCYPFFSCVSFISL